MNHRALVILIVIMTLLIFIALGFVIYGFIRSWP